VADVRATSLGTLVEMVASGIGVTLLPTLAIDTIRRSGADVALLPFTAPGPRRTIGIAWRPSTARRAEYQLLGALLRGESPGGAGAGAVNAPRAGA
jgi:LysR family hydrogen peroxide-inducible transcriptional activator